MKGGTIENVELSEVSMARRPTLESLMQFYLHDFSEFAPIGTWHGEVGDDGKLAYDGLDLYWQEEGRVPLFIFADGRLAGFALVHRWSALDRPMDRSVAEFFVLRKYRRSRIGSRAAALLFERFPGRWEVPVASYNQPALAFWRKAMLAIAANAEEVAGDGKRWAGTVLCFERGQGRNNQRS